MRFTKSEEHAFQEVRAAFNTLRRAWVEEDDRASLIEFADHLRTAAYEFADELLPRAHFAVPVPVAEDHKRPSDLELDLRKLIDLNQQGLLADQNALERRIERLESLYDLDRKES